MADFFVNFYAVPLQQVLLLMILGFVTWILLGCFCVRKGHKYRKIWESVNKGLCIFSGLAIIKMTLIGRTSGVRQLELWPFYTFTTVSYNNEAYRTLLMNIFLFFPLGLTLPWALPEEKNVKQKMMICAMIGIGFSIVIEGSQFLFELGWAETDDVICNALGCMIGAASYYFVKKIEGVRGAGI